MTSCLQYRHCVSAGESEESSHQSCGIQTRYYNVPLRIGTLFVILITSATGVFAPILLSKLPYTSVNCVVSTIIKQFGTGIIIATAFIHVSLAHGATRAFALTSHSCIHMLLLCLPMNVWVSWITKQLLLPWSSLAYSWHSCSNTSATESSRQEPPKHPHHPQSLQAPRSLLVKRTLHLTSSLHWRILGIPMGIQPGRPLSFRYLSWKLVYCSTAS